MADPATDAVIAAAWPDRWSRANVNRPGASKRRNNLRKAWAANAAFQAFKSANPEASCANCQHLGLPFNGIGHHCELDSDFHGYAVIGDLSSVCVRHEPAKAQP